MARSGRPEGGPGEEVEVAGPVDADAVDADAAADAAAAVASLSETVGGEPCSQLCADLSQDVFESVTPGIRAAAQGLSKRCNGEYDMQDELL